MADRCYIDDLVPAVVINSVTLETVGGGTSAWQDNPHVDEAASAESAAMTDREMQSRRSKTDLIYVDGFAQFSSCTQFCQIPSSYYPISRNC